MKKTFSILIILSVLLAVVFVFAKITSKPASFKQAEDFPRDALIYAQIQDLPVLIKLWNDSEIRQKYLESANFGEFQGNHLGLKLAERANEINEALGIFPDLGFASSLSENKAALAVYNVGKMEFVFIAPASEEKILASSLFQLQLGFEEIKLDDETIVYSKEIDIDRQRQKQKILFTNFRGRLILATSEKYFLQTIDNIKGKTPKNRLSAESSFAQLAKKTKPNLASVWLNQQKLNNDWYFIHYWLMSETENLKNLRAGMFDFEIQDKKIVEKRVFLTAENKVSVNIAPETANRLGQLIPPEVPFYRLETARKTDFDESITDMLFDVGPTAGTNETSRGAKDYYFRDWEKSYSYSYLDDDFREEINQTEDDEIAPSKPVEKTDDALTKVISAANPNASLKLFSTKTLPPPLFFENRNAIIFSLQNPNALNSTNLETALSKTVQALLTANNQTGEFTWTNFSVGNFTGRQLPLPLLGWTIFYAVRQNELILSNSEGLMKDILSTGGKRPQMTVPFDKLTVINLDSGREEFNEIFGTLEKSEVNSGNTNETYFFTGNIGSLLDAASGVERIEIKQNSAPNFLFEEIDFVLKDKPE